MSALLTTLKDIAPALIGGGVSLMNHLFNVKSQRDINALNQANFDKTFERNIKLANLQNDYNSAGARMQRLSQAGLNPNLVYDNGASIAPAVAVTTPTAPNHTAPQLNLDMQNAGSLMQMAIANKQIKMQDALNQANIKLTNEKVETEKRNQNKIDEDIRRSQHDTALADKHWSYQTQLLDRQIRMMDIDEQYYPLVKKMGLAIMHGQFAEIEQRYRHNEDMYDIHMAQGYANIANTKANTANIQADTALKVQEYDFKEVANELQLKLGKSELATRFVDVYTKILHNKLQEATNARDIPRLMADARDEAKSIIGRNSEFRGFARQLAGFFDDVSGSLNSIEHFFASTNLMGEKVEKDSKMVGDFSNAFRSVFGLSPITTSTKSVQASKGKGPLKLQQNN